MQWTLWRAAALPTLVLSVALVVALAAAFPVPGVAQITFTEVASSSGIPAYEMIEIGHGAGIAAADFDDDGDVDIFLPTAPGVPHLLYRNLGNGQFEDVAAAVGLIETNAARGALWLDYDGDHRLDLLLSRDCLLVTCVPTESKLELYRQTAGGNFQNVTLAAGLFEVGARDNAHRSGLAAADVNGDGFLDFVTGYWNGTLRLLLNGGDGTFSDTSIASGLDEVVLGYHQPMMQDFDGDGLIDIFVAVDFTENRLWLNQGSTGGVPSFLEVAASTGCDNDMNDMGMALGDFDADGDADFYVSNIYRDGLHNILLRNNLSEGTFGFTEVSAAAGVQDGAWGWGTTFFDGNNDGLLDLAETNGWFLGVWSYPPRLFLHQGDSPPTFVDIAATAGLTDTSWGSSLVAFDYDRDGDLDLMETITEVDGAPEDEELRIHQNQLEAGTGDRHYLVVRPRMTGNNARAIGAKVSARIGAQEQVRWITAGTSYLGQEPAEAFFGLGAATVVDRIVVSWPDGTRTLVDGVAADQVVTLTHDFLFQNGFESGDYQSWSATSP